MTAPQTAPQNAPQTAPQISANPEKARAHLHAFASFDPADFPVPHGREEEWRFTPLDRLRGLHDGTALTTSGGADGKVLVEITAGAGAKVETVGRDDPRIGRAGPYADRVAALAFASFTQATVVTVPADAHPAAPTFLTLRGEGADGAAFGHVVIDVAPFAEAIVVIDHQGSATYAGNVEVLVGDGARCTFVSLQDWADDSVHLAHHLILVGRDAQVRAVAVTFGGSVVRLFPQVHYAAPGGDAELLGLYFADAGQHIEHRLFADHNAPRTRSNVNYKGALQGRGPTPCGSATC